MMSVKLINGFTQFPKVSAFKVSPGMVLKVLSYSPGFATLYLCPGRGRRVRKP